MQRRPGEDADAVPEAPAQRLPARLADARGRQLEPRDPLELAGVGERERAGVVIQSAIHEPDQRILHEAARAAVAGLARPLFKSFHRAKAEVATWLAWQRAPGAPVESAIGNRLIDFDSSADHSWSRWIGDVFA